MVTPTNDQDRLIDQALSLLRNAMAETKTVLPVVQFRPAEPKALLPSSVQEERAASLVNQTLPMVENIAVSEAPSPSLQQPVTKQASKDVLPTEPPVQEEQTPSLIDQTLFMVEQSLQQPVANQKDEPPPAPPVQEERTASLINQTLSMVAVAVSESTVTEAPPASLQQPVAKQTSKEVVPTEPPVQEERKASLIAQALSMVKSVATAEPKPVEVAPSSFQQPVAKKTSIEVPIDQALSKVAVAESTVAEAPSSSLQPVTEQTSKVLPPERPVQEERTASLIGQKPSMVEIVAVAEPKPVEAAPPIPQQPIVKQPTPKERLDMERAEIRTRVATFKANQQRFQREREEYYATTMAKARATPWTPPKP